MAMHSLRPHSMEGHMALYKAVLHHSVNALPKWLLETLGVWVSSLNACHYCVEHHFAGLKRLLKDDAQADAIRRAIKACDLDTAPLTDLQKQAMRYAEKLTLTSSAVSQGDVEALRMIGRTASFWKSIRSQPISPTPTARCWVWVALLRATR